MKWFTRAWQTGELSDVEWESVNADYEGHVTRLRPSLPSGLRLLAEGGGNLSLHDAWFIDVRWKVGAPGVLFCDVASWDMQKGTLVGNVWTYPALHVRIGYRNAEMLTPSCEEARKLARRTDVEILYGEIERVEGDRLEHRMLLWPPSAGSFEVRFDDAEVVAVRFDGMAVSVVES